MPYPVFFVTGDLDIGVRIGLITRNGQLEILLVIKQATNASTIRHGPILIPQGIEMY